MKKFWRVFWYEYTRHVLRKRFLVALISMPLIFLAIIAFGMLSVVLQYNSKPVGFVDPGNVVRLDLAPRANSDRLFAPVELRRYASEPEALSALQAGELQGVYVLAPDFAATGTSRLVSLDTTSEMAQDQFRDVVRASLVADLPEETATRVLQGAKVTVRSLEGTRQTGSSEIVKIILPFVAGILFIIAVNISGGYLAQALVEEKENRTMEIVVTSVSPEQLMAGKIAGDMAVGLTQLGVWVGTALLALLLARMTLPAAQNWNLDPGFVLLVLATLLPAFVLVCALMAMAGVTATESREAQQVASLFTLPLYVPFWLLGPIMQSPNSGLAVGFSLFPLTAPMTLPLRAAFTNLPAWQIALSLSLLVVCAAGALWLAGRAFRMGMLRYGKRLSLKEIFSSRGV